MELSSEGLPKRSLRLIAHRVFGDRAPIRPFGMIGKAPFHGVELDVRCDGTAEAWIDHAPLFMMRARRNRQVPKSFRAAMHFLAVHVPSLEMVLLDIKSVAAAEWVGAYIAQTPPRFEVVFACWHAEEAAVLRRHLPQAVILYCLAPIFAHKAPRGRFRDLYLSNSYPFLSTARRFAPQHDKPNCHNINIKLMARGELAMTLPPEVDGLCVHRLFCSPELAAFTKARNLRLAVYGLCGRSEDKLRDIAPYIDYAIIRKAARDLPAATSSNRDRAIET
jgi:hypothetical protein